MNGPSGNPQISVVLPCRNEEESLERCILKIKSILQQHAIDGEIIVSDSSTDNSPLIARRLNVTLVKHNQEGYGRAYLEGFKAVQGEYIFCADPDGTYDFTEIPRFLHYLRNGYDFVIGNRFEGEIKKGAMPFLHRYVGNPLLSFILRIFFKTHVADAHCGMRAIRRRSLDRLALRTSGMEFASEMVIKSVQSNLRVKELPINYYRRAGKSKLRTLPDGWRHLRLMLGYALLPDIAGARD